MRGCIFESYKRIRALQEKLEKWKTEQILEAKKGKKKWIQKMVKSIEKKGTKGAFREWCEKHGFTKVNKSCIEAAKREARKTGDTTLLRRAVAAENMLRASGAIK